MPVVRPRIATTVRAAALAAAGLLLVPAPADAGDLGRPGLDARGAPRLVAGATAGRSPWRAPVAGAVVGRFAVGVDPFARGQRRGTDFAARPGAPVGAPCRGRVSFAGAVPRHRGAVAIRCGRLTATVLGLALPLLVTAGEDVVPGSRLGAAAGGRVRLGARRTAERFGYVDPERLIGAVARDPAPPAPAARRARRARPRPAGPAPTAPAATAAAAAAPTPRAAEHGASARTSAAAWVGLALLAAALTAGTPAVRRRRRPTGEPLRAAPAE